MEGEKGWGRFRAFHHVKTIQKQEAFLFLNKDDHEHCDAKSGNEQTNRICTVMVAK